ncbi:uncharacterized protein N7469_003818 [Penicillium citrinum]|uniref:SGNH hydrolase-type esterase domain-containing protein n=1 Tax=Penicillium citrinum TaxID=5077 RepID=A0A9W9P3G2_PENCI|nr:uncharacterized protein N7469_003818 [Penicillium citrinum]KAJ5234650.1 hypothetical protein N7469_003818 [Penicillium citrinum]
MRITHLFGLLAFSLSATATILENGQERLDPWPGQAPQIDLDDSWKTYEADEPEVAFKGRWDSQHGGRSSSPVFPIPLPLATIANDDPDIRAPGIKTEFTGNKLAVSFGPKTSDGALVAYRVGNLDWQYSNVTADSTYQFIGEESNLGDIPLETGKVFEMRVQVASVSSGSDAQLNVPPKFDKKVEVIGGSVAAGQYGTYETLSSWSWLFVAGLGNVEHTLTAYPGVCLVDKQCYGGQSHGMNWYWHKASDPGSRAREFFGDEPEDFDVKGDQPTDLFLIQMGGNDHRHPNEIPGRNYYHTYVELIDDIHRNHPHATVLLVSQWGLWRQEGLDFVQDEVYEEEHRQVHEHFKDQGFVYYFNTKGILQHNDINPKNHPTDVGHIKLASHLLQWVRVVLRWELEPLGEVTHGTLYWNNMQQY